MPDGQEQTGGVYYDIKELLTRRDMEQRERWERIDRMLVAIDAKLSTKADVAALQDVRALAELNRDRVGDLEEAMSVFIAGRKAVVAMWSFALVAVGSLTGLVVFILDRTG